MLLPVGTVPKKSSCSIYLLLFVSDNSQPLLVFALYGIRVLSPSRMADMTNVWIGQTFIKEKIDREKSDREFRRQEFLWLGQSFGLTKDWWPLKTDSLRNPSLHFAPEFLSVASFGSYMLLQSSAMTKLEPPGQGLGVVSHTHTHMCLQFKRIMKFGRLWAYRGWKKYVI